MGADVQTYELWLRAAGYRPDTIARAVRIARQYVKWCDSHDPHHREQLVGFLAEVGERIKRVTLLNYWKDLELFFRFAVSEGLVVNNPLHEIPKPKPSIYERERDYRFLPYTDQEFRALMDATPYWNWLGLRDRALLHVLWDTPLRVSEIVGLDVADVEWDVEELKVRDGKNAVKYEGILSVDGALALHRYLQDRPHENDALFVDVHGGRLTRHALELLLRRLSRRAHWTKPCYPHAFRANWRLRMRMLGLDDAACSAMMGHATVVVTHGYARQVARQMAKAQLRQRLAG